MKKIKSGYFHYLVCNTHHLVTTLRKARFSFDSRNRLIQAGSTSYRYDAENQRIGVNQTRYVVNSQPALSQVLVKEENGVKTFYVYGLGLIGDEKDGEYRSYHFDFRGSTVALTDKTGKVVQRFQYGPYGELLKGEASVTPFLFNGKFGVMSDGNGLSYMRTRFYSPEIKRFVNMDVLVGNVGEGQTLNRFAFVTGQPVNLVDPFGWMTAIIINGYTLTDAHGGRGPLGTGNPFGHAAIATTGSGVYSFGNDTVLGSNLIDYLRRETERRNTTVIIIDTTPEQERKMLNYLDTYRDSSQKDKLHDTGKPTRWWPNNCAYRTSEALQQAGLLYPWGLLGISPSFPTDTLAHAEFWQQLLGGETVFILKGSKDIPWLLEEFNPRK